MSKQLSVIIPGYNTRREWWVRCARSISLAVVKACGDAGEVLCVDDGSREPVDEAWFDGIPLVRVIRLAKNAGLPMARNAGLKAATGEFVAFVDSDDEVKELTFQKCLARLEETEADIAVYGLKTIYPGEGLTGGSIPEDRYYGCLRPVDVKFLVKKRLFYYSCNKVFRRSFIDKHLMRFDPLGVPCEDAIFNVACVVNQAKWVTVNYAGYIYYRYDGSLLSSYQPTLVEGQKRCAAAWKAYKDATPGSYEVLGNYDERSESIIAGNQWTNIWRRKSPYSLLGKWRWLKQNRNLLGVSGLALPFEFFKKGIMMFVRGHFYITPIRRWRYSHFVASIGGNLTKWDGRV